MDNTANVKIRNERVYKKLKTLLSEDKEEEFLDAITKLISFLGIERAYYDEGLPTIIETLQTARNTLTRLSQSPFPFQCNLPCPPHLNERRLAYNRLVNTVLKFSEKFHQLSDPNIISELKDLELSAKLESNTRQSESGHLPETSLSQNQSSNGTIAQSTGHVPDTTPLHESLASSIRTPRRKRFTTQPVTSPTSFIVPLQSPSQNTNPQNSPSTARIPWPLNTTLGQAGSSARPPLPGSSFEHPIEVIDDDPTGSNDVPMPDVPMPDVPMPDAPMPDAPMPDAPMPDIPTPVAPTPIVSTPVAPPPVAPPPVVSTPVAPPPVAPTPVVSTPDVPKPDASMSIAAMPVVPIPIPEPIKPPSRKMTNSPPSVKRVKKKPRLNKGASGASSMEMSWAQADLEWYRKQVKSQKPAASESPNVAPKHSVLSEGSSSTAKETPLASDVRPVHEDVPVVPDLIPDSVNITEAKAKDSVLLNDANSHSNTLDSTLPNDIEPLSNTDAIAPVISETSDKDVTMAGIENNDNVDHNVPVLNEAKHPVLPAVISDTVSVQDVEMQDAPSVAAPHADLPNVQPKPSFSISAGISSASHSYRIYKESFMGEQPNIARNNEARRRALSVAWLTSGHSVPEPPGHWIDAPLNNVENDKNGNEEKNEINAAAGAIKEPPVVTETPIKILERLTNDHVNTTFSHESEPQTSQPIIPPSLNDQSSNQINSDPVRPLTQSDSATIPEKDFNLTNITILSCSPGVAAGQTLEMKINLTPAQEIALQLWKTRAMHLEDVSKSLCLSLACYNYDRDIEENVDIDEIKEKFGEIGRELFALTPSWPTHAELSACIGTKKISLAPPVQLTAEQFVDISAYVDGTNRTVVFVHYADMTNYVYYLFTHNPLRSQLRTLEVRRARDKAWQDSILNVTRPFTDEEIYGS